MPLTGVVVLDGLLGAAVALLSPVSDLHGLGATRLLRRLGRRFEVAPDEAPLFFDCIWRAAVQATLGCVQQVYDNTDPVTTRGEGSAWHDFVKAHARVSKDPRWRDGEVPQATAAMLVDGLSRKLAALPAESADVTEAPKSAHPVWARYCEALRRNGFDAEPPEVVHEAFFGERPEPDVWPWSRHFVLRIGEQLRENRGFRVMFDALQFAGLHEAVARLIADAEAMAGVLGALSARFDRVEAGIDRIEAGTERLLHGQKELHEKLDLLLANRATQYIRLQEEVECLRLRPEIRIEDLIGWLKTAFDQDRPLKLENPEKLPELLRQALTVDLPNLRQQAETYRLDPLASPEAHALLHEVRALLLPQPGKPLDLQEAKARLEVLDDRVVAERMERRRCEDRELAELRVLRAETERTTARYAAAAMLMEQAADLGDDPAQILAWRKQAAEDWYREGELYPGTHALRKSAGLWQKIVDVLGHAAGYADACLKLGMVLCMLGERLNGPDGMEALQAAESNYKESLKTYTRATAPAEWAVIQNHLGMVKRISGDRQEGLAALQSLRDAEVCYRAALEIHARDKAPVSWATSRNNLGITQNSLAMRLAGASGLIALREALTNFHAALEVYTFDDAPVDWAMTHNNIGAVQRSIGERLGGDSGLMALLAAERNFIAALRVNTREAMPVYWAMTQNNLGGVQTRLAERLTGVAKVRSLQAAASSFNAALEIYRNDTMPVAWVTTQNNLGAVQAYLGEALDGEMSLRALNDAKASYCSILEFCRRDEMPTDWAMVQNNLGTVQRRLSQRLAGMDQIEALRAAEACFYAALEVRTRDAMPISWAMTQANLGNVQSDLGRYLAGEDGLKVLRAAENSYRAALEVFARDTMPAYWQRVIDNHAIVKRMMTERGD